MEVAKVKLFYLGVPLFYLKMIGQRNGDELLVASESILYVVLKQLWIFLVKRLQANPIKHMGRVAMKKILEFIT